jgi:hypothetical protein
LPDDEDGGYCAADNPARDAAHEQPTNAATTSPAEHDDIGRKLLGRSEERVDRSLVDDDDFHIRPSA